MFQIGDKVVHPMHGAGVIDSIVDERINGKTQAYYVFRMPVNGLVLKIPTANSEAVGLRAVVEPAFADQVIDSLSALQINVTSNWNRRLYVYLFGSRARSLRGGPGHQMPDAPDSQRGLSTGERKMLHSAKQIFISEIVLSKNVPYGDIEGRLNASLMSEGA